MDREPLVSVIMTNYNHDNFLEESMKSVLGQTYRNIQFIVVDDGSTDRSVEIMRSFQDERMEIYPCEENVHISAATNYAMQYAKGEYVAIADSDDIWNADKLEKQIEYLLNHPEYDACFTWADIIDENGDTINEQEKEILEIFNASTDTREEWLRFFFYVGNRLLNDTSVVSMKALKDVGEHNVAYVQGHDFDWWVRFTKKYRFAILEEAMAKYRRYTSAGASNTSARNNTNDIRFYNEYMSIRRHFFDGMDNEIFVSAFSPQFRNPDSKTDMELECEKAFLLCAQFNGGSEYSACGLERLEDLLQKPESKKVLQEKFRFNQKDFYQMNGNSVYVDKVVSGECKRAARVDGLEKLAADLNELLESKTREVETLTEFTDALKLQKSALEGQLQFAQQEVQDLGHTIEEMHNSTSWKITKPIRGVKNILKSGE